MIFQPLLNKGTAFSEEERTAFGLHGLLPAAYSNQEVQAARVYGMIKNAHDDLEKYVVISNTQDRNEHLFYRLLMDHLEELMPIIYTPTVGKVTQKFSQVFRRGRGVWISPDHKGSMVEILREIAKQRDVELMVVTDNESILGIGDQGAGGMAISIGKLALYCAGAGIHPVITLPVSLDFGTNNQSLLDDDLYIGYRHPRLTGEAYDELLQEFVEAAAEVFPHALIQWEDFKKDNALNIMDRYREICPSFNDDIQGTGAVAFAGILSALRISGSPIKEQRVLIHGAGAAGLGISRQIRQGFVSRGMSAQEAKNAFAVTDSRGLIYDSREGAGGYKQEMSISDSFMASLKLDDPLDLVSVINGYMPTILIGASGQAGAFDEASVKAMHQHVQRPIILPFSNPTHLSEAIPADVYKWTNGEALVATGSPFDDVEINGRTIKVGQGNNVFIFPGLGFGSMLAQSSKVTDGMISAAANALAGQVSQDELDRGLLYPTVVRLREVSLQVARAVVDQAIAEGVANIPSPKDTELFVRQKMWRPDYPTLEEE